MSSKQQQLVDVVDEAIREVDRLLSATKARVVELEAVRADAVEKRAQLVRLAVASDRGKA